jgi:hypothetical protein
VDPDLGTLLGAPICGFNYDVMVPYGSISLPVIGCKVDFFPLEHVVFNIIDFYFTYDAIIDIPTLRQH